MIIARALLRVRPDKDVHVASAIFIEVFDAPVARNFFVLKNRQFEHTRPASALRLQIKASGEYGVPWELPRFSPTVTDRGALDASVSPRDCGELLELAPSMKVD
jgi:hypothetical protein